MDSPHLIIALLSAGICLAFGLVSLFSGLHKDGEKTDLVFGIMCLCMCIFFIIPPAGFILTDHAPYSSNIIIKRIFNFSFLSLLPWFVSVYTGYKKKFLPLLIDGLTIFSYLIMAFTAKESDAPLWLSVLLIPMGLCIVHAFLALRYQFRSRAKAKAMWLLFAMVIFLLLYLPTAVQHVWNNYFSNILHSKIFFPVNLFPLALIIIMGTRLRGNTIARSRLEKALGLKNMQWHSLLEHVELIIVHLDNHGKVKYINPYGVSVLHCNDASEILQKNWFDYFLPGPEVGIIKGLFQKIVADGQINPHYKNSIITKDGIEKIITWTNEVIYSAEGNVTGVMSIGSDITDQEKAFLQIQNLKAELEKENLLLKGEPLPEWMHQEIIGRSDAIMYAIQKAKQVASTQASVLLEGETGVGKELFANLIQRTSLRNTKPFVKVNCGALPAELIEDELFGHEKGAFTGAIQSRKGRFELADGGTIFLDEIGELPLALQPKLLRVLQSGEFQRIGGQQTIMVDVRVIAANNKPLEMEVKQGRFRDDLFYRLNVFPITIPSLRNRKEDIPMLIQFFIDKKSKKHGKTFENISKVDLNHLCEYEWPGNIRELKNVIERSVIASENNTLRLDWFYHGIKKINHPNSPSSLEQIEKEHILKMLNECQWRIGGEDGAAEKLVMHPSTLRSRMKKLNIIRPSGF
jgi:formate hydrogenlyase transcriptional activator